MKTQQRSKKNKLAMAAGVAAMAAVCPAVADESTMDTVVVTASRTQEAKREISSNVTVITSDDIKASTASTIADVLVQQGFFVVTTGDTSNVQIRGFGSLSMTKEYENSVLILLNGHRTGTSNVALAGLANVERIEIIRGPSAVQYGSSAMGGVINVITKRGKGEKLAVSIELGIGSDNLKRQKIAVSGATNGFDYAFGGTNSSREDMTMNDNERWHHSAIDNNTTASFELGYTFDNGHRVGINHYYGDIKSELTRNNGGFRGDVWAVPPVSANAEDTPYGSYAKLEKNTTLSYSGQTQDKIYDWSASYTKGGYEQKVPANPAYASAAYKDDLKTDAFNAQAGYNGSMVSVSAGMDYYNYDIKPSDLSTEKYNMRDIGMYATGKLRLLEERLIFSVGLRHDRFTNDGNTMSAKKDRQTTGSVGVAYLPLDWLKLRANYAEGFKMPSPTQLTGGAWYSPNYSLVPEQSKTWEFGTDINWNYVSGSLTWFHSDWKNKIVTQGSWPAPTRYENLDAATLAGLEGSLSVDLGKAFQQNYSLKPYVGFTWLETRENKDKSRLVSINGQQINDLANTPEWMVSYGIDYAHPGYKLKGRINANYYGEKYTRDYAYTGNWFKQNSGTVVNLSVEKELVEFGGQLGKLTLRTEVNNLLDGANEMYWGFPDVGRSFYVGLRYDFR